MIPFFVPDEGLSLVIEILDGGFWFPVVYKLEKAKPNLVNIWKAERILLVLTADVDNVLNDLTLERLRDPESERPKDDRGLLDK